MSHISRMLAHCSACQALQRTYSAPRGYHLGFYRWALDAMVFCDPMGVQFVRDSLDHVLRIPMPIALLAQRPAPSRKAGTEKMA